MNNKDIQKERTLRFFVEAAKSIIEEEGASAISARKVGDRAGYSYATLYNYFKDMKDLLAYCAYDYLNDCFEQMMALDLSNKTAIEAILIHTEHYFRFFAEQPNIFHIVFIEDLGEYPQEMSSKTTSPAVGRLLHEQLQACVSEYKIKPYNVDIIHQLLITSLHGKLLFLMHKRHGQDIDSLVHSLNQEIKLLIQRS